MFNPSQADVRRYFCAVYAKAQAKQPLEALETIAAQWIDEHPEYHADLRDADAAVAAIYDGRNHPADQRVERGRSRGQDADQRED